MRGVDLIWLVIGVMVAAGHLFTGALTLLTARKARPIDILFAGLLFIAAWYSLWTALIHAGFALTWPWIMGLMSLLPGFIGPGLFILTLQITRPERKLPWWAWATIPFGAPATLYSLLMLGDMDLARACAEALLAHGMFPDPTILFLWRLHSAQLAIFAAISLGLVVHGLFRPVSDDARELTRAWLGGILAAMGAILVANVIPSFVHDLSSARLGPLLSLPTIAVAWHAVKRNREHAERLERHAHKIRPYLAGPLRDLLRDTGAPETLSGQMVEQTLLLADIRQFTALCERLPAVEVVHFLNQYMGTMAAVVARNEGTVDKYIGDAIFAVFPPGPQRDDAERAMRAAREMLEALEKFNQWWNGQSGRAPVRIGIGLHRGRMVQGTIGSPDLKQFTVVGDTVNTVSRVEALTKELKVNILLTREVKKKLPTKERNALRSCGLQPVPGRQEPLSLWTPDGVQPEAARTRGATEG